MFPKRIKLGGDIGTCFRYSENRCFFNFVVPYRKDNLVRKMSTYFNVRLLSLILFSIILLLGSQQPVFAADNTAPFFTAYGKVTTDFSNSIESGYCSVLQSDGKIIVAGFSDDGSKSDFALARYMTDGSLDTSFGTDGKVTTDFFGRYDGVMGIALQPDGKIVVAGSAEDPSDVFALARYNIDGSLDTSFGVNGKIFTDIFGFARDLAIQLDGKIVVIGTNDSDFVVARYTTDGSLDTSFDTDGTATTDFFGESDCSYSVVLQPDGKIVVAGYSSNGTNNDFALARYNIDGSLDASFGIDGKVTTDFGAGDFGRSVVLQPDGKIIVVGNSSSDFALARYNSDGSLDTNFGTDGKVITDFSGGDQVGFDTVLQIDGKIVVVGVSSSDFALARYNSDGSLDTTFGTDGKVTTDFSGGGDVSYSVVLQPDGKIILSGHTNNSGDFALARYTTDGNLDTTFHLFPGTLDNNPTITEQHLVLLNGQVQIYDAELYSLGNYEGAALVLMRHEETNSEDTFSAKDGGTLTSLIQGSYFAVDSVTIGQVITNSNGTLTLTFATNRLSKHIRQSPSICPDRLDF